MSAFSPRVCAAALTPLLAVSGLLVTAWPPHVASSAVVISEVYGGGGNSHSVWTNDFVELYNRSDTAVDVSSWVVQYYSATATAPANTTTLSGTVASHHAYLVRMSAGTGGTTALPTPDATGTA
jgi:predicted extracellular nuclease